MKITIITATWNSESTIRDTLESVSKQRYKDVEHIVVDGASVDGTLDIVNSYSHVHKVVSSPDDGIYDALNKGIAAASGEVVGFLHSDDLFAHPGVLEKIAAHFQRTGVQSLYGDLEYVSREDISMIVRYWRGSSFTLSSFNRGWMPAHPTFYMRRDIYNRLGGFNLSYKISADYDAMVRYLWLNGISTSYLPHTLIKMRVGGISNGSLKNILRKTREDIQIMRTYKLPWWCTIVMKNTRKLWQFRKWFRI